MKKKTGILLLAAVLLCSGCGRSENNPGGEERSGVTALPPGMPSGMTENAPAVTGDPTPEASGTEEPVAPTALPDIPTASPITESIPTAANDETPYWAQGTQLNGKLFQNLNLDGVGDADDEAYVSVYRFGDGIYGDRVIALRVHLGTGETLAEIYPVSGRGYYSFMTGRIFSEDREAIVLGYESATSNYGATELWVLKVSPDGIWTVLDTTAQPDGMTRDILRGNGEGWGLEGDDSGITRMTRYPEVVDIKGSPLQGLKVTIADPGVGAKKEWENVIYWKEGKWTDEDGWSHIGKWEFLGDWTLVSDWSPYD